MQTAALYLRSSKDRSDVSIDAQRRKLRELATQKSLTVVAEFTDAVESGKDDNRPGFQNLLRELKSRERTWQAVLLLDTSRLSRNIYVAEAFKHECRKRDVRVLYANLPEANPMIDLVIVQIFQAFDQLHSMMSREKGLAGMAENVKQGFRAGGRAPWGYALDVVHTGAVRDGAPVAKTRLVLSDEAGLVSRYLKARAAGRARTALAAELAIHRNSSSLIGTEWNALTYAGHTVWNVHNERTEEGYKTGTKRRPRSEWVIQRETHEALISDEEAEAILARLEGTGRPRQQASADYLLSGLLVTPQGEPWHGNSGNYRTGKRNVVSHAIERAVIGQIASDWRQPEFIRALVDQARAAVPKTDDAAELVGLQNQKADLLKRIEKITSLLDQTTAVDALLRQIEVLEEKRVALDRQLDSLSDLREQARALGAITEKDVAALLDTMAESLEALERPLLKDWLREVIMRVELDPVTDSARIEYRVAVSTGVMLASPRGFEPRYSP